MRLTGILLTFAVGVLLVGCPTYTTFDPRPFVAAPREVEDWEGVPRLARAWNVLFAGQPTEEGFRLLAERGVTVVVNLRPDAEMQRTMEFDESALVESLGMEYVHIPMTPGTFSPTDVAQFKAVFDRRKTVPGEPFTLVIHCRSSNRCGALWAAFLHDDYGFDESKAIEYGKRAGLRSESMIEATKRVMND